MDDTSHRYHQTEFYHRYDNIALAYVKNVLGRTTPLPVVTNINGKPLRRTDDGTDWYKLPVKPDLDKAEKLIEHDRIARTKKPPKYRMMDIVEYWGK